MKVQHIGQSLTREERETHIWCEYADDGSFKWFAESSIPTHITKLSATGWTMTGQLLGPHDSLQSATFETTMQKPLSFRDTTKPKREMSEEEKERRRELMRQMRNKQLSE
jgi:hypothetical protein